MSAAPASDRTARSDRRRTMITPEGIVLPLTLASRGARAGALILDLTFVFIAIVVTTIALISIAGGTAAFMSGSGADPATGRALEFLIVVWFAAMFLFRNAWFLYFELGPRGATPGKRISGIRIAARPNSSGGAGRLSAEMVIARNLLRDIELFLPLVFLMSAGDGGDMGLAGLAATAWFLIFALFPFFNRDRLRAGDLIAGTWVVEAPRRKLEATLAEVAAPEGPDYQFGDEELAIYGEYELQTLERVLREQRPEAMEAVAAAICRKIAWTPPARGGELAFLEAYYTQLRARLEAGMRFGKRKADKHE
jgi:uncharacterized RDD family membrane protein YckC